MAHVFSTGIETICNALPATQVALQPLQYKSLTAVILNYSQTESSVTAEGALSNCSPKKTHSNDTQLLNYLL